MGKKKTHNALPFSVPFQIRKCQLTIRTISPCTLYPFYFHYYLFICFEIFESEGLASGSHDFHAQAHLFTKRKKEKISDHCVFLLYHLSLTVSTCWFETPLVCLSILPLDVLCVCHGPSSVFQTQSRNRRDHLDWVTLLQQPQGMQPKLLSKP